MMLGVDIENKQPKLTIKDCNVEMERLSMCSFYIILYIVFFYIHLLYLHFLDLDIHKTKAKWLYNAIISIISNKVKNQISQLLTVNLSQQLAVLEVLIFSLSISLSPYLLI